MLLRQRPIALITNTHIRRLMQARAATLQLQRGPNHLAKSLAVLSYGKAERPKRSKGSLRGRDRAPHEFGRARNWETGDRKLEKYAEGRGRSRGGVVVFTVVEKAARLVCLRLA
jgi:hypothetical protein